MVVESLKKNKDNTYTIIVNHNAYVFDEDIIVEFRLVKGKEITQDVLDKALEKNTLVKYYNKALNYALTYGKSKAGMYDYLEKQGLSNSEIAEIIDKLSKLKILDDDKLIKSYVDSFIRKSYGKLLIEQKLIEKKFSKESILEAILSMDYDAYLESLQRLYDKVKDKYKLEGYAKIMKIKKYLLSRGYTFEDLSNIDIKG